MLVDYWSIARELLGQIKTAEAVTCLDMCKNYSRTHFSQLVTHF